MAELTGGCQCGHVRYRLDRAPFSVHCCHCTDCQRETGSGFAINGLCDGRELTVLQGEVETIDTPSNSGAGQVIARCPICKVALWSHYSSSKEHVAFMRCGTLDTSSAVEPDVHIFVRSKLPWVKLPEGVKAYDAYFRSHEMDDIFGAERAQRRRDAYARAKT